MKVKHCQCSSDTNSNSCHHRVPPNQSATCSCSTTTESSGCRHKAHCDHVCHKRDNNQHRLRLTSSISTTTIVIFVLCFWCWWCTDHLAHGQFLKPPKKLHRIIAGFYAYHPSYDTDKPAVVASSSKHQPYHVGGGTNEAPPPPIMSMPMQPPTIPVLHDHGDHVDEIHPVPLTASAPPPNLPLPLREESKKNAYHYRYHTENDVGGNFNYHDIYGSSGQHKPKYDVGSGSYRKQTTMTHSKYKKSKKSKEYEKKKTKKSGYKMEYHKGYGKKGKKGGGGGGYTTGGFHGGYAPYWPYLSAIYQGYMIHARKLAEYYGHKYHYPVNALYWQIIKVMFA